MAHNIMIMIAIIIIEPTRNSVNACKLVDQLNYVLINITGVLFLRRR